MNWILWVLLLVWAGIPINVLLADRILGVSSNLVIKRFGTVVIVASVGLLVAAGIVDSRYLELAAWGVLIGFLGSVTLDVVRLLGVRAGAFPIDMPVVFGFASLGQASEFQQLVMSHVLRDEVARGGVGQFIEARISRLPSLSPRRRINAAAAMMGAVARLPEDLRDKVSEAQFSVLSSLEPEDRRTVMAAMDEAGVRGPQGQPRGLPRIPMATFRRAASAAIDQLKGESPGTVRSVLAAGYTWHLINGISFGVVYTLLFGQGSWVWAIAWGLFVWLAMMVSMPPMMPVVRFPSWFPIVPLIAHMAMILPFLAATAWVSSSADQASLLG